MLQCSVLKCENKPKGQCDSCNGLLLCKECYFNHVDEHIKRDSSCLFGKIMVKLSDSRIKELKSSVQRYIGVVEKQKNLIMIEALKITNQIDCIVRCAFENLDKMIEKYNHIYMKNKFDEKELDAIQALIEESLSFEYPYFSKITGDLIKPQSIIFDSLNSINEKSLSKCKNPEALSYIFNSKPIEINPTDIRKKKNPQRKLQEIPTHMIPNYQNSIVKEVSI